MKRIVIVTFFLCSLPAYAADDPSNSRRLVQVGQPVFHQLDQTSGTWSGWVQVSASPCTDQPSISTQFTFTNVKDQEQVLKQIAPMLDSTEKTAEELEKRCKK
jgi:hypothetical protein